MNDFKDGSSSSGRSYISCMKINGIPLLPPLMTPECRQEMQYYKQLAVAVERRINDLRFCLDETTINSNILHSDSEEWCDGINISMMSSKNDYINESFSDCYKYDCLNTNYHVQPNNDNNEFESMNSQLTVIDNEEHLSETKLCSSPNKVHENSSNKTAKVEQIIDTSKDAMHTNTPTPTNLDDFNSNRLKNAVEKQATKELCASKDINFNNNIADHLKIAKNFNINIESTKPANTCENSKNDVSSSKTITKPSPVSSKLKKNNSKKDISVVSKSFDMKSKNNALNLKKISKKSIIDTKNKLSPSKNATGSLNNISSGLSSPPKLVRQNSYTLEYPSPLLLAHLEVQSLASGVEMHSISMSDSTSTSHLCNTKQKNLDSNIAKEVWSSLGSDINSLSLNECSVVAEKNNDVSAVKEASVDIGCDENMHLKNFDQNSNSTMSSAQNAKIIKISESQILNSSVVTSDEEMSQHSLSLDTSNKSQNSNNSSLKFILKKFEEEHSKKLAELVRKQKEEQILLQKSYESQQKLLLAQFQSIRKKENRSGTSVKSSSINETENKKCDSNVNQKDTQNDTYKQAQVYESVSSQSHSYSQKTPMKAPANVDSVGNNSSAKSSPRIANEKRSDSKIMRLEEFDKITNDPIKKKLPEYTKDKDYSACDTYDQMVTSASANTLDDINITFASDDFTSIPENSNNNTPLYSNVTVREIDGMSKLKSAFDKITRIQQNLASQSSFKYPVDLMSQKTYYEDDCLSTKSQTVSLSSIGTISQLCSEPEIHYPVMDRNALSLNLVDISRPQSSRHQNYFKHRPITEKEIKAATTIVAHAKGYLTRRLMRTEKVETIVQTIRDTLLCALQLYKDEKGIQGPDVDLHRRLIQQITAACYALHDMFIISTPAERMSIISQDRERKISLSYRSSSTASMSRQLSATTQKILKRKLERMSNSHSGVFTSRSVHRTVTSNPMTRSHYDQNDHLKSGLGYRPRRTTITVSGEHGGSRKPWR